MEDISSYFPVDRYFAGFLFFFSFCFLSAGRLSDFLARRSESPNAHRRTHPMCASIPPLILSHIRNRERERDYERFFFSFLFFLFIYMTLAMIPSPIIELGMLDFADGNFIYRCRVAMAMIANAGDVYDSAVAIGLSLLTIYK